MAHRLAARCQVQRHFSPVAWTEYFDEAHDVQLDNGQRQTSDQHDGLTTNAHPTDSFRVYLRNFRPPYAPHRQMGQAVRNIETVDMTESEFSGYSQCPTLVALHGGGYSALTWAQFTRHIEQQCHCRVLAIDLRSHGDTKTSDDDQMDIDTLVDDVIQVIHSTHRLCGFPHTPKLILVGHSMGGAIAIKCSTRSSDSLPSLAGFVIIDVVEGTAKDALPLMMTVIKTRPTKFPSLQNAIEWSVRSGMAKNLEAAQVSMPGNLLNITTGHLAIHDIQTPTTNDDKSKQSISLTRHKFHISIENLLNSKSRSMTVLLPNLPLPSRIASLKGADLPAPALQPPTNEHSPTAQTSACSLLEEEDEWTEDDGQKGHKTDPRTQLDNDGYKRPPNVEGCTGYCWRTDLAKTQPYWPGWFEGLSEQMLNAPVQGKFLLLAGIDRLDKTLTIGQMQGKFMMKVLPKCGHAVHEDSPERVATEIGQFLVRNKFTAAIEDGAKSS